MKTKANIGIALVIAFVITLTIGVILPAKGSVKNHPLDIRLHNDGSPFHPLDTIRQNAERLKKEVPMVLRRHRVADYPVHSHTSDRFGQTAFSG